MNYDIAIIGAGVVGAACAYRFSLEGFRVILIEAGQTLGGTTAAGMGHIVVMDDSEAQFSLTRYSQKLWRELAGQLPKKAEYEHCGTIWVAADEEEFAEVLRKKTFYRERGVKAEILDEKALLEAEPNLRKGLKGGLLVPDDGVVYQLCAAGFFLEKAFEHGAKLQTGTKVLQITENSLKLANGGWVSAGKIINAAGFWSKELDDSLKISRRKGQLVITERYTGFVQHQLVELGYLKSAHASQTDSVAFNIQPRLNGQMLIGSTRQYGATDKALDFEILRRMISRAVEYMPEISGLTAIRAWTGFRPATPDNLPYIGKSTEFENVYLAAGHEGLGITTSLGTAELLLDEILERDSAIPREPFSPARFG